MSDGVDGVIARVLDWEPGAEKALIAAGRKGARRVFDLYYGRAKTRLVAKATGRELVDGWSAALHVAATLAPEEFLARLPGRVGTTEIVILGDIDDSRATDILREQAEHEDFLHRVNAVRALAKHTAPESREAVEKVLADQDLVVRSAAIRCVADRDPGRGIALYEAFLRESGLTPLLGQEARWVLSYLREGRQIPRSPW
ncbi:HEAT repeat domain-containing protein [Catellatospora sp. KI3]|uniref:HEAT repeat domain-containing protein n=1 Tax=Catellatospora sp. KI3 TaxID=3041620 RepID=UPI002482FC06|nr:HEAT repeat domain-containing protein [Catellatospora sp. KI3]MDI1461015.1 HEAT repeat domain-containing protein [Catellatospora sp. KI3]